MKKNANIKQDVAVQWCFYQTYINGSIGPRRLDGRDSPLDAGRLALPVVGEERGDLGDCCYTQKPPYSCIALQHSVQPLTCSSVMAVLFRWEGREPSGFWERIVMRKKLNFTV